MTDITLYAAPGSCSKIAIILLEELGVDYKLELIRFMKGQHKSPEYKKINPKGKVPALVVNGEPITENPAMISLLNELYPEHGILPIAKSAMQKYQQLADLCFCGSTLHPVVTRIRIPHFFASPEVAQEVWEKGCAAMDEYFQLIDDRLANSAWWYGDSWSAMDAYLYWIFWRVEGANYDTSRFPNYAGHAARMAERASVKKASAHEKAMEATLEQEGLSFAPPTIGAKN